MTGVRGKGSALDPVLTSLEERKSEATVHTKRCHIRRATSFSKLPLKKNLAQQDKKVNFEGAGLGWAGHWRENCYEPCPCREKGLCAWAVEGAWEAGGPGRSEPGNRKQRGQ